MFDGGFQLLCVIGTCLLLLFFKVDLCLQDLLQLLFFRL